MDQLENKCIWPGWETVRLIGRGSYGAVYEVRRRIGETEERAAVKCLSIPQDPGEIRELRFSGFDEESLSQHFTELKNRIRQEYETMLRLKGSPNIVSCEDLRIEQHDDGIGWDIAIRMELLTPLMEGMGKTMDEEQTLRLGRDMARALSCCHRENIVHRDVKPQNMFLDRQGNYKLGDFGVARTMEGTGSATVRTGTYRYMAPEVFNGRHYGPRADLYSLGLVLYWLLNDRRSPFIPGPPWTPQIEDEERSRARRFAGEPLPPPAHGSERLKRIVLRLCAFDPKERYQNAEELLHELNELDPAEAGARKSAGENDRQALAPAGAGMARRPVSVGGQGPNKAAGAIAESPANTKGPSPASAGAAISRLPAASDREAAKQEKQPESHAALQRKKTLEGAKKPAEQAMKQRTSDQTKAARRRWALPAGILAAALLLLAGVLLFRPRGMQMTALRQLDEAGAAALQEDWICLGYYEYSGNKEETEPLTFPVGEGLEGRTVRLTMIEPAEAGELLELTVNEQRVEALLPESGRVLLQIPAAALTDEGWAAWEESLPADAALTAGQGQAVKESRFRVRETCVVEAESLAGWELIGPEGDEPVYGPWSDWSEEPIEAAPDREIQEGTLYRSREKESVTSKTTLGDDWELTDTDVEYGEWGPWSDWQVADGSYYMSGPVSAPAESDQLQVQTKPMYAKDVTIYDWNGTSWVVSPLNSVGGRPEWVEQKSWQDGEEVTEYGSDGGLSVYPSKRKTVTATLTATAFRTSERTVEYTYHYTRFGAWSDWSEERPEASDALEAESGVFYRFRDLQTGNGPWSEWSLTPIASSPDREIQEGTLYRSREKECVDSKTPLGEDWELTDTEAQYGPWGYWSDWSENAAYASDTRNVETRTQYCWIREELFVGIEGNPGGWQVTASGGWEDSEAEAQSQAPEADMFQRVSIQTRTIYRVQERTADYTYHYARFGAWSDWSEEPVEEREDLDVESAVGYRSRILGQQRGNRFARWSDWSAWQRVLPPMTSEEYETETRVRYRARG